MWLLVNFCLRDTAGSPERARWLHLARSGSQSQRAIWFILPAHGASHLINICYSPAGRSVLGKTVPEVSSTARGRRPRAVLETEGTVFPNTDRPGPVNNIFIYFLILNYESKIQTHCVVLFILFRLGNKIRFHCDSFRQNPLFFYEKVEQ